MCATCYSESQVQACKNGEYGEQRGIYVFDGGNSQSWSDHSLYVLYRECVVSIDYFTPIVRCREKSRFRSSSK